MGDELSEALKQSLEELVAAEDVAAAIEKVKRTYDWVGLAVWDVFRFIGEDAVRLAASALAKYDHCLRSAVIAQRLRPSEGTEEDKKIVIQSAYRFMLNDEIAAAVNAFSYPKETWLKTDPVGNLLTYAADGNEFQEAVLQLTGHYAQNPEVVQEALSVRIKEFPELVELLASNPISGVIKNHRDIWMRSKLVAEVRALAGVDATGTFGMGGVLSLSNPNYLHNTRFRETDAKPEDLALNLSKLISFFTQYAEPLLGSYKGHEREFADLAFEAYRHGGKDILRVFAQIIGSLPSQAIGFDVARAALKIWENARNTPLTTYTENLLGALQLPEFKDALLKSHTGDLSKKTALKGLVYTANRHDLEITGNVAKIFATSSYSDFLELESFFNLVMDEGRYFGQLRQLAQAEAPLAEKTVALSIFAQLKKAGVEAGDPSSDPSWREAAAETVRQFLFSKFAKLDESDGGRVDVDAESRADIEKMRIDQLVDFLNVRSERDASGLLGSYKRGFPGPEFFLAQLPEYRVRKSKHWPLGKEYGSLANRNGTEFSPTQLAELLVSGLIGRVPERRESARQVFGSNLDLARSYVLARVMPKKAYHAVKPYLNEVQKGAVEAVEPLLAYFSDMIRNETLAGNVNRRKIEALSDVLEDVKGAVMETAPINLLIARLQQVVPSDLFDNRALHCCTFYPSGIRRSENMRYFEDGNIALLYFLSPQNGKLAKQGVAILLRTALEDGSTAVVVDSVESSPLVSCISGWEDFALSSIRNVAADAGVDKIVVNNFVQGSTPKCFVAYAASQTGVKNGFFAFKEGIELVPDGLEHLSYEGRIPGIKGCELSLTPTRAVASKLLPS